MDLSKNQRIGIKVLITLNLVFAVWSTFVFLVFLQVPTWLWLFMNICAPTQYITCIALILDLKGKLFHVWELIMVPFLAYFGTGGFFRFSWSGVMLTSQFSHMIMTCTWILIVWVSFQRVKDKSIRVRTIPIGLSIGLIIVVCLLIIVFPVVFSDEYATILLESMGFTI